jgi:hypothetical protein
LYFIQLTLFEIMKHTLSKHLTMAALAACSATHALATTIYADNANVNSCVLPNCSGTASNPFKLLSEAVSKLTAGSTLNVNATGIPYYIFNNGTLPAGTTQMPNAIVDLKNLSGLSPSTATLIKGVNGKPIVRGSLIFSNWVRDTRFASSYIYYIPWTLMRNDGAGKLEPQQVFRKNGVAPLVQVGGEVFGGYPDVIPTPPDLAQAGIPILWPGRVSPASTNSYGVPDRLLNPPAAPAGQPPVEQFYYDQANNRLYVQLAAALPANEPLEVSVMRYLVSGGNLNNLQISNMQFERTSTSTYSRGGAVSVGGSKITLDQLTVQYGDTQCIDISGPTNSGNIVQYSAIQNCGQMGIHARGDKLTITNNTAINYNNYRGFEPSWEAGGIKLMGDTGVSNTAVRYNVIAKNNGDGVWFDTAGTGPNSVTSNLIAYNSGVGAHVELSSSVNVWSNILLGNGAQGLQMVDSSNVIVLNNRFIANAQGGIYSTNDSRSTTNYDVSVGNGIQQNYFGWNDDIVNRKPVWIHSATFIDVNNYCGSGAGIDANTGLQSLHFWMSDLPNGQNSLNFSMWKTYLGGSRDTSSYMAITSANPSDATYPASIKSYVANQTLEDFNTTLSKVNSAMSTYCIYQ